VNAASDSASGRLAGVDQRVIVVVHVLDQRVIVVVHVLDQRVIVAVHVLDQRVIVAVHVLDQRVIVVVHVLDQRVIVVVHVCHGSLTLLHVSINVTRSVSHLAITWNVLVRQEAGMSSRCFPASHQSPNTPKNQHRYTY